MSGSLFKRSRISLARAFFPFLRRRRRRTLSTRSRRLTFPRDAHAARDAASRTSLTSSHAVTHDALRAPDSSHDASARRTASSKSMKSSSSHLLSLILARRIFGDEHRLESGGGDLRLRVGERDRGALPEIVVVFIVFDVIRVSVRAHCLTVARARPRPNILRCMVGKSLRALATREARIATTARVDMDGRVVG